MRALGLIGMLAIVTAATAQEVSRPSLPPSYFAEHSQRVARATVVFERRYTLDELRDRDRLALYGATPGTGRATALGGAIFGATTVMTAHAPRQLRPLFDARLHLGPALFSDGGLGAAAGGRF